MEHKVRITLTGTNWSGWDPEGYSIVTSAQFWTAKGKTLSPETLGLGGGGFGYEVLIEHVVVDRVGFAFKGLVIENPGGTVNLTLPREGRFILRPGETKNLSTATMDAGTSVTVTLDEIR